MSNSARRKIVEMHEENARLNAEVNSLRAFAQEVMQCWPMGDLDGGTLQDAAEKHGLLRPETRHEPCGEGCACAEYALPVEFADGVTCYRKTPLLTGQTHNAELTGWRCFCASPC